MKINSINLENFRGYKILNLDLHPNFNLIIGDNGSGKTALLEGITVAMGAFFLGIKNISSRHILSKDIHIKTFDDNEEYIFPVKITANGEINQEFIEWSRELNGIKNRTTSINANSIKLYSQNLDNLARTGEDVNLPLLAYYATGRLFDKARSIAKSKNKENYQIASRFRAYERCLEAKSTYKHFVKWYKGKELSKIQKNTHDIKLETVKNAIISNIPNCDNIFYEFDPDKQQGLKMQLKDHRTLPFTSLSDGTRNYFAIIADIAYKCVTLNPHLKDLALRKTEGVVLIDELDLHLHPEWQRKIIHSLRETFPNVQFITTTHSPFLIQETANEQLIVLKDCNIDAISSGINLSIEDIAEELQKVKNPQWSKSRQKMSEIASKYYKAVKSGNDTPEMKQELDEAMKPFAKDTAFYSILEQEKIKTEYKKQNKK
ncbi:MAG: AAA family ATPase [Bacteroidales bacterium]|nr:AAA family ATPase [Bacteroidales bacterium]